MQKYLLALAILMGTALVGLAPAWAYYEGPWCAIVDLGPGSSTSKCDFPDFESCRREITGGNRGFCNHNPRWSGASTAERVSPRRRLRY
jgi:Protein of unknown function (DUF3551)